MKKNILILAGIILFSFGANAQKLEPEFLKKYKEIVALRTEVMDLDKRQVKALKKKQKQHLLNVQKLRNEGLTNEEFQTRIKVFQKDYNEFIVDFSSPEQRIKFNEYMKSKRK